MNLSFKIVFIALACVCGWTFAASYNPDTIKHYTNELELRQFNFGTESFEIQETTMDEQISGDENPEVVHAMKILEQVKYENRFVEFLDSTALVNLPVGIVHKDGKKEYAILVDSLVITPKQAYLTVYLCIPIPQSNRHLVLRGDRIVLSKEGGITGEAKVYLVNNEKLNVFGTKAKVTIKGGPSKTYATWDCSGFKELNLDAEIEFNRNCIQPPTGTDTIRAPFKATIQSWNDLVTSISLPPFIVPSLHKFEFTASNVILDLSDYSTPEQIAFPEKYESPFFVGKEKKLWRGLYLSKLNIKLPEEFKLQNSTGRISFEGQNMLVDDQGFTGSVGFRNLFSLQGGSMNGWNYSLDSIGFAFMYNSLTGAGFKGKVVLPVNEVNQPFQYTATINPGNSYLFSVQTKDTLNFDLWKAKVQLQPESYLEVKVEQGEFKPSAVLTGEMNVASAQEEVKLLSITFEELKIMSEAPYLDAKAFSLGSEKYENSVKSFPVSISDVGFKKGEEGKASLVFKLSVHLTGENEGGFKGEGTFNLHAKRNALSNRWRYDGVTLTSLAIEVDGGSYRIKGSIAIYEDDPIYGKGYNGSVQMFFEPGFDLNGTVLFGKVNGFRYWYTDAFVGFPTGIPFCGPLAFYGFGGGMYHNMEQVGFSNDQTLKAGKTLSGIVYKPNLEVRYGFKATVQIGLTASKETFNGDATLEFSFERRGGLRRISLLGNAYLFNSAQFGELEEIGKMVETMSAEGNSEGESQPAPTGMRPEGKDALISGHLFQYYDFNKKEFHGEMEMYVDVFGLVKGIGPNGLAGWSVMHYGQEDWYIYIGTPDRRVGIKILNMFSMNGYFMTGSQLEGSPEPPAQVSRILGNVDMAYMRDENALGTGRGVAFGGGFSYNTGNLNFLMFYGKFGMGAGFDVMLKNYGEHVRCKGRSGNLGINGWYANGQAYAYAEGDIGIRVKLFYKTKKIKILSIAAAVVLQAKLPNPVWMRGTVGGRFSVLGGLVKGHCSFKLEIGEECEIIDGSVLEGLHVISDLTPANGLRDVSVFASPQAVFNFEIDKEFSMEDVDEIRKTFRIKLDQFSVISEGQTITGKLQWNEDKTTVLLHTEEVLPPNKELTVKVIVSFEERVSNSWEKVKTNGTVLVEELSTKFYSGSAPDFIPLENIEYAYPQLSQVNFYPKEFGAGYIKLKRGQTYLLGADAQWATRLRFTAGTTTVAETDFKYENTQVNFTFPDLPLDKVLKLELVKVPKVNAAQNLTTSTTKIQEADVEVSSRKANSIVAVGRESTVLQYVFRVSKYPTFSAKMDKLSFSTGWSQPDPRGQGLHILGNNISGNELFDVLELYGSSKDQPLISMEAKLVENSYYNSLVYPLVYDQYTSLTSPAARLTARDLSLGIPPVKAVYIQQYPDSRTPADHVDLGSDNWWKPRSGNTKYELSYYMKLDYLDLQAQTARYITHYKGDLTDRRRKIMETPFPVITKGNYYVEIKYALPGINKVTFTKLILIRNNF